VEQINIEELQNFVSTSVEIAIIDEDSEEQPLFRNKKVFKIEMCPDQTHVRIYFDTIAFFAIPISATVIESEKGWKAYDQTAGLYYCIREVQKLI
jgi:hypothetical protein